MEQARIAVLIDADNSPASKIDAVLSQAAASGSVNVRRAYGNWTKDHLKGWTRILHEFAITPIQQFDLTQGKNASDIAMVIDAMDLLHGGDVDGFAIVSSDSDFTPLVTRLRQSGAEVVGFGAARAPEPFRNACTRFYNLASLHSEDDGDEPAVEPAETADAAVPTERLDGAALKSDPRLIRMLRAAIDEAAEDDGWAPLGAVGMLIRNRSSIEPRNYGYAKFSGLVQAIDLFETRTDDTGVFVRRRVQAPARKTAAQKTTQKTTQKTSRKASAKPAAQKTEQKTEQKTAPKK